MLGVASLIALSGCAGSAFAAPVNTSFKDDNLFTCVLQNYNHKNSTTLTNLTATQLASIETLDCSTRGISDATGIETMTNLVNLDLSTNEIEEIDLSSNTKLKTLDLSDNKLTELDVSKNTALESLLVTDNQIEVLDLTANVLLTEVKADDDVTVRGYTPVQPNTTTTTTETPETETAECASITLDDEQVNSMKELLTAYGYNTSAFNAMAVKIAASQINMCDGANREEMRGLFNAMGILGLSDAELDEYARQFTNSYNAARNGESVESIFGVGDSGVIVPNTGAMTGEGFGAAIVTMSVGTVAVIAGVFYMTRYGVKRRNNRVAFRR